MSSTTVTVLIENTTADPGLHSQHGLSLWLDTGHEHILVDTGQDGSFLHNARMLGIDIAAITRLVFTHGHYDHTGGVPALLETGVVPPSMTVHPQAWDERIACPNNAPPRSIGIPWSRELLNAKHVAWQSTGIAQALAPGIWSTGSIPNFMGVPASRHFQRKRGDYWHTDRFPDEQSLVLTTEWGLVIITVGGASATTVRLIVAKVP